MAHDPQTDIGLLVNIDAADELERQLDVSLGAGAKLLCGSRAGRKLYSEGLFEFLNIKTINIFRP